MVSIAFSQPRFMGASGIWAGLLGWPNEVRRREPVLTAFAIVLLLAMVPTLLAAGVDTREVNGISVWVKPSKFLLSLAVYYLTMAWYFGYAPAGFRSSRVGRFVVYGSIAVGAIEMLWLVAAAVAGVPSHFNRGAVVWSIAYGFAGVGATTLLACMWLQARAIARSGVLPGGLVMRRAIAWSAYVAAITTLATAFVLAAGAGHWVGGTPSDAQGLPLLGWSRDGGDLRVAHFWSLHAQQIVPFLVWLLIGRRSAGRDAPGMVAAMLVLYVGFVAFTFVQALAGKPFLG